jgi:hypothetical protein
MQTSTKTAATTARSEATILSRLLLNGEDGPPPELARYLLGLSFDEEAKARMHELALKNQAGRISHEELRELDSYIMAGDFLALLQARARKVLKTQAK